MLAAAADPALARWSISHPPDDASYVHPESEIFASGDGLEAEEFLLFLRKDGVYWADWEESTDAEGIWDRTPLSENALPVGEYFLYISFGGDSQASVGFDVFEDMM